MQIVEIHREVIGVRDVLEGPAQQLVLAVSDNLAQAGVHPQEATIASHQGHADRRVFESALELFLAFLQGRFGNFPLVDVLQGVEAVYAVA